MQLEHSLLCEDTRRDAAAISRLIVEDFIEFGASGSIWTKAQVVEQLPQQSFTQRAIKNPATFAAGFSVSRLLLNDAPASRGISRPASALPSAPG
ncbi:DUF4440 domain-containing protein [Pseudomonas frederiksbergensis]|jgi:hypothetical protein|uniref:DUF4440 domain-containing protein n=1 Tax=Pseudomonas frederiksbergensis TaxID=104087 RepID=UPI00398B4267